MNKEKEASSPPLNASASTTSSVIYFLCAFWLAKGIGEPASTLAFNSLVLQE